MVNKLDLLRRRGYLCEICRKEEATDLHHCLFRRDKRKPELNHEINYECLCHTCHMQGYGDTLDHRRAFYIRQVERYGYEVVEAWLESLSFKIRCFEFVEKRRVGPALCPTNRAQPAARGEYTGKYNT